MKICFFGVGGIGGYFGSIIANKLGNVHDIYFVARGSHKDAICSNGLTLKKKGGLEKITAFPKLCTDKIEDLPVCDLIILSVKSYDLVNATETISKITNKNTIILPLLNGVDIYDRIRKHLNKGIALPSCVYVGTHIESPGVIFEKGGFAKIAMGYDPEYPNMRPEALLDLFKKADISFTFDKNIYTAIWTKYIFVGPYSLTTALSQNTYGELFENAELIQMTRKIMCEVKTIADKLNIILDSDIVERSLSMAKQFPDTRSSFSRDVELKGKINESDIFIETLINYGERLCVPVPGVKKIKELLQRKIDMAEH
ncbi:MAG: ketopantoate reductase family protein [bacterium]|nr:ketopantoate reductase family protein [bacterium]